MGKSMIDLQNNGDEVTTLSDGDLFLVTINPDTTPDDKVISWGNINLTNTNISPTTSNVTASVSTRYFADISGLTANRNFILPTPTIVGQVIELNIVTGDNTYFLILIGDTGVTINGGSAATEFHRLQSTGRKAKFRATSLTNWMVEDGCEVETLAMGLYAVPPYTATGNMSVITVPGPFKLVSWICAYYNFATVDGSKYWTIKLGDNGGTNIASFNTSVEAAWTRVETTSFSKVDIVNGDIELDVYGTKVSTTGDLFAFSTIRVRMC